MKKQKKAALIAIMVKAKMHPSDVSKTLLGELFGYTDIDKMITNLERLTDKRPDVVKRIHEGKVKPEFLQTMESR